MGALRIGEVANRLHEGAGLGNGGRRFHGPKLPPGRYCVKSIITPNFVYFVYAPASRLLKIGISTDPEHRFSSLQTGSPEPLVLIGWADFGEEARQIERELHGCWGPWRVRGEWFEAQPEILTFARETSEYYPYPPATENAPAPRPTIPPGVDYPTDNSRKSRMARYLLARGLAPQPTR